jgi:hypothetical protein
MYHMRRRGGFKRLQREFRSLSFDRPFSTAIIVRRDQAAPAGVPARCRCAGILNCWTAENGSSEVRKVRALWALFPAKLSVGIMFVGRPFAEPTLLRIASAYEAGTKHRIPPPDFGPVPEE